MSEREHLSTFLDEQRRYAPPAEFAAQARVKSKDEYERLYRQSLDDPDTFWKAESRDLVFRTPWTRTFEWTLPHARWFIGARLNASESCLDRHLDGPRADAPALLWEGEPEGKPGESRTITYRDLHRDVVKLAAALRGLGVRAGDRVTIYMGMVPEVVVAMLACARIGAPHSVVFGGFAAEALRDRINDCGARIVITQDGGWRRGHVVPLKHTVDQAVAQTPSVEKVIVFRRLGEEHVQIDTKPGRDVDWEELLQGADERLGGPELVDSEHPLFILYTSGSTGKPKGVLHTTAGYLVGTHVSTKYVFDLRDEDVFWCTADVGWVTGHS